MNKIPRIGVSVILIDKDKILLGLRKGSHGNNTWGMPGGHLEWKETFLECAKREIKEELGVTIRCDSEPFFVTNDYFTKEEKHYVTVFVVAQIQKGIIQNKEPHKCVEWRWFNYTKIPKPLFLPVANFIKQKSLKKLFIK